MTEQTFTPGVRDAFLAALRADGIIGNACAAIGVSRSTVAKYRASNPDFDAACADAIEDGIDVLETEAFRRATRGVSEPVFHRGEVVGEVQRYSDTLLSLMLTRRRYKETVRTEVAGHDGGALETDTQAAARIAGLLALAAARKAAAAAPQEDEPPLC